MKDNNAHTDVSPKNDANHRIRKGFIFRFSLLILFFALLCTACKSNVNMYRHNRSHCDCPTF